MWFLTRSPRPRRTTRTCLGRSLVRCRRGQPSGRRRFRGPACAAGDRVLRAGFYTFFDPISYSADHRPQAPGIRHPPRLRGRPADRP